MAIHVVVAGKIPLHSIRSSAFSHIGYNPETQHLDVKWPSGAINRYFGVKPEVYETLKAAPSAGRYFMQHVKPHHATKLMTGDCPACGDRHGWFGETCTDCGTRNYGDPGPRKA